MPQCTVGGAVEEKIARPIDRGDICSPTHRRRVVVGSLFLQLARSFDHPVDTPTGQDTAAVAITDTAALRVYTGMSCTYRAQTRRRQFHETRPSPRIDFARALSVS